jgi:hypothetical protein
VDLLRGFVLAAADQGKHAGPSRKLPLLVQGKAITDWGGDSELEHRLRRDRLSQLHPSDLKKLTQLAQASANAKGKRAA